MGEGPLYRDTPKRVPASAEESGHGVLDGPASVKKGSKGRIWLDCIRGKGVSIITSRAPCFRARSPLLRLSSTDR